MANTTGRSDVPGWLGLTFIANGAISAILAGIIDDGFFKIATEASQL